MKIGIIGAGTMGNGIAHVFSLHDNNVILVDISKSILENALLTIGSNLKRQFKSQAINKNQMKIALDYISISTKILDLRNCDIIIEAVKEDLNIKSELFKKLDSICKKETIFATNTSSISINQLSNTTSRCHKFIGMHFMNPVPLMKLIEIIKGEKTSDKTLDFVKSLSKSIDKIPIECNDAPGFVSNRILMPMINEAAYCLMEGVATPESIDSIMKLGMNHPIGPLKLADLIGIDICVNIMNVLYAGFKNKKYQVCPLLTTMVTENKLGKKTKEGFYKYEF